VILSYSLIAYSPWEGMRVAITGTRGRVELEVVESTDWLGKKKDDGVSQGAFKTSRIRVFPLFDNSYDVEIPPGAGGHGGADPLLLEQLFSPTPPPDPLNRSASHIDGAASILLGIAANRAIETKQVISIDSLFPLPDPAKVEGKAP
jgi:hypothetical protein